MLTGFVLHMHNGSIHVYRYVYTYTKDILGITKMHTWNRVILTSYLFLQLVTVISKSFYNIILMGICAKVWIFLLYAVIINFIKIRLVKNFQPKHILIFYCQQLHHMHCTLLCIQTRSHKLVFVKF